MERTSITNEGIVMNRIITRPRKRSRALLGSTMAMLVALPLGAALGASAATASTAEPSPAAATTTPEKSSEKASSSEAKNTLGEAVPWTAGRAASAAAEAEAAEAFDALVFSETAAFEHSNIDEATTAIQQLGATNNFTVTATEDSSVFNDANLEQYEVVIFLSTTGDVLTPTEQAAFERYIQGGGGYAGIHAASDTEYDWPWYGSLVGAYFNNHPAGTPSATVKVEDPAHPSTAGLPKRWQRTDEWYNFRTPNTLTARNKLHILASMDETTYAPGTGANGVEHPIAWCQDYDGGRSWYTGMGHTEASFTDAPFLKHILGGIQTAAGVVPSDCKATLQPSFEKVALDENTTNPMELDIADDGRVFYIDRAGAVKIILPNRQRRHGRHDPRLHRPGVRSAGHRPRPRLRHQQPRLPLLRTQRHRVDRPDLPLHDERQHAGHGLGGDDPRRPRAAQRVLPRGWVDGVRPRRQPLPRHR